MCCEFVTEIFGFILLIKFVTAYTSIRDFQWHFTSIFSISFTLSLLLLFSNGLIILIQNYPDRLIGDELQSLKAYLALFLGMY